MVMSQSAEKRIAELEEKIRALEAELSEAEAESLAKEVFLSNMSHDIRTPMNAIVGMTSIAKKHIDEKPRVQDALNKIEIAGGHLLSLINDVLDMSRINSGRLVIAKEQFSLSDLLHDTMTIIRPQMAAKNLRHTLKTDSITVEALLGDVLRLRQVFVNILNNAVKYTPEGGSIDITVSESMENGRCTLFFCCKDTGIGMTKEFLTRIFEPFERVNSSTISKIEGTGLGMSIVKKLVDAMAGTITIESEPGKGTSVTILVPLEYETLTVNDRVLLDKNLLILEGDPELRARYDRYLTEYRIPHRIVDSSSDALSDLTDAEFHNKTYDAAILGRDRAEGRNPIDFGSYLHRSFPNLLLIYATDENWEEIEYLAERAGIHHNLTLPFFRKSLINTIAAAFTESTSDVGSALPNLAGKTILLVEDNLINQEIAKEILCATGANVDVAENGQEAVSLFTKADGRYQLILMDVQMPVMNGYEATKAIRASGAQDAASIPIYAMTANTFAEDIQKARQAGMNGHIAKPIDVNLLMQVLKNLEK